MNFPLITAFYVLQRFLVFPFSFSFLIVFSSFLVSYLRHLKFSNEILISMSLYKCWTFVYLILDFIA